MWEEGDSGAQVWLRDTVNMTPTPAHLPHPLSADLLRATFHDGRKVPNLCRFPLVFHVCRMHVLNALCGGQNNGPPWMLTS